MENKRPTVAMIYDFDGTLSPGNMQEFGFIQAVGNTPEEFWHNCDSVAAGQEMSHVLAYMKHMIDKAEECGIELTRESFVRFGHQVELYPGVEAWFDDINRYGEEHGVTVEHYINSSGLTEIIEGTSIAHCFKKIFACSFLYDEGRGGNAVWPAVAVDYTAKTQFLFKITKGIMDITDSKLVNESRKDEDKPIPFPNMIYFGDGQTDVPCMKIVKMFGGNSIAVYDPASASKVASAKKLLEEDRVNFICKADYSKGGEIYNVACAIIDKVRAESEYNRIQRDIRSSLSGL